MNNNEKLFQEQKAQLLTRRKEVVKGLSSARKRYEKILRSNDSHKEIKLQHEKNKVALFENRLDLIDGELRFLRPGYDEDIAYRVRQNHDFAYKIAHLVPDDIPLRFHGCPIFAAEKIISSGEITSQEDRLGINVICDDAAQISVTTKDNLYITTQGFANLTPNFTLPAGCIFVVTPKDLTDEESGRFMQMDNVRFKNDSDRLVAVISTPENLPSIQAWLTNSGLPSVKATDFDGFVQSIDRFIASVNIPYRNIFKGNYVESTEVNRRSLKKQNLDSIISGAKKRFDAQFSVQTQFLSKSATPLTSMENDNASER